MNQQIKDAFLNAMVARAAYVDMVSGGGAKNGDSMLKALKSSDYQCQMTDAMASYFAAHFSFVDSSLDSSSGYDAILFRNNDNGQYCLGNRGTQTSTPPGGTPGELTLDLGAADVGQIVLFGVAWTQAYAMEEFYKKLFANGITEPINVSGHSLGGHLTTLFRILHPDSVINGYTYNGAGVSPDFQDWISNPESVKTAILAILGASGTPVESAITFAQNIVSDILGSGLRSNSPDAVMSNYVTQENRGVDVVSNAGETLGNRYYVNTDSPLSVAGHAMGPLSDALLVAYVLSSIDDSLSLDVINRLAERASGDDELDRNVTIASLADMFGLDTSDFRDSHEDNAEAALQHAAFRILEKSEDRSGGGDFNAKIMDLSSAAASDMVSVASQDNDNGMLMRYALMKVSTIALSNVTGDIPQKISTILQGGVPGIDLYNEDVGTGSITKAWIKDRAAMLSWLGQMHREGITSGVVNTLSLTENWSFTDLNAQVSVMVDSVVGDAITHQVIFDKDISVTPVIGGGHADRLYAGTGGSELHGGEGVDYLEGNAGADKLYGDGGKDRILGLAGDDTLIGGKDADRLEGGKGTDTYIIAKGDGIDTIFDSDGLGSITMCDVLLSGGKKDGSNTWLDEENKIRYVLVSAADGTQRLQVFKLGGNTGPDPTMLFIEKFTSGDLGIRLEDPPAADPAQVQVILGDVKATDFEMPDNDGGTYVVHHHDALGNIVGTPNTQQRADELFGSAGIDEIHGGMGNDSLHGRAGNDVLRGDAGDDLVTGGLGRDDIDGGIGNDILYGDSTFGTDTTQALTSVWGSNVPPPLAGATFVASGINWARYQIDFAGLPPVSNANPGVIAPVLNQLSPTRFGTVGLLRDFLTANGQGVGGDDVIDGGAGDDLIYGEAGDDYLMGGEGKDRLYGGSGDDVMNGGDDDDLLMGDGMVYAQFRASSLDMLGRYYLSPEVETYENEFGNDLMFGGSGDDYMFGMAGADILYGQAGNDYMVGDFFEIISVPVLVWNEAGNEWVQDTSTHYTEAVQYHGNDVLDGGEGDDYLIGLAGDDQLMGGDGNDVLLGDGNPDEVQGRYGNDYLEGGSGNDFLQGSGGNDELYGGAGDDELWGDEYAGDHGEPLAVWGGAPVNASEQSGQLAQDKHGRDFLDGGDGNDTLIGGGFDDHLEGGAGNDLMYGDGIGVTNEGNDQLFGGTGDDELQGNNGDDLLSGDEGDDRLYGGDGADILQGGIGSDYLEGGKGDDKLSGAEGNDTLFGNEGDDTLEAGAGDDSIDAGEGNDTINGGAGVDYMRGGAGDDVFILKSGDGEIRDNGFETIDDVTGTNFLRFDGISAGSIIVRKAEIAGDLALQYGSSDGVYIKGGMNGAIATFGLGFDVTTTPSLPLGTTTGAAAGSADAVRAVTDPAMLSWFNYVGSVSDSEQTPPVLPSSGTTSLTLPPELMHAATLSWMDFLGYFLDDSVDVTGDGVQQALAGGRKSDHLVAVGMEIISGGGGNDTIELNGGGNTVLYRLGDGLDTLQGFGSGQTRIRFAQGIAAADIHLRIVSDPAAYNGNYGDMLCIDVGDAVSGFNVRGLVNRSSLSASASAIMFEFSDGSEKRLGDYFANGFEFSGTPGADHLEGTDVNDSISGGDGDDWMQAGAGNDVLSGGKGNDSMRGNDGEDTLFGAEGNDSLYGDNGADLLDGGAGNDSLEGGQGADTYLYRMGDGEDTINDRGSDSAVDILRFGEGITASNLVIVHEQDDLVIGFNGSWGKVRLTDQANTALPLIERVEFSDGSFLTAAELLSRSVTGPVPLYLRGTDGSDVLRGEGLGDRLEGLGGNDGLFGLAGDDVLDAGAGNDYLEGGAGNDTLLGGAGNDELHGSTGSDHLYGGDNNDYLDGENRYGTGDGAGPGDGAVDYLYGGSGDDVYVLHEIIDQVIEYSGEGNDSVHVYFSGTWTLPDNVEEIFLETTNESNQITANALDNSIYAGHITFEQSTNTSLGADVLIGGDGNDTYYDVFFNDVVVEDVNGGIDTVHTRGVILTLGANVENAITESILVGTARYGRELYGNNLDNILTAGTGEKTFISSGGGNDTLYGGSGNDQLYGNYGDDVIYGSDGSDYLNGGTGSNVMEGGSGADTIISEGDNDTLTGGGGNDFLALGAGFATCVFYSGSGNDWIKTGAGGFSLDFKRSNLTDITNVTAQSGDLKISYLSQDDQYTVSTLSITLAGMDKLAEINMLDTTLTVAALYQWLHDNPDRYLSTANIREGGSRLLATRLGSDLLVQGVNYLGGIQNSFSVENGTPIDPFRIESDGSLRCLNVGAGIANVMFNQGYGNAYTLHAGTGGADDFSAMDQAGVRDWYVGGSGSDTYYFSADSGLDTIDAGYADQSKDVIQIGFLRSACSLGFGWESADLSISHSSGNASLRIIDFFSGAIVAPTLRFSDGEVLTIASIYLQQYGATSGNDVITGTVNDDSLYGWTGNDILKGMDGNDTLNGGAGADQMTGGNGDDYYMVDNTGDTVVELANGGVDYVSAAIDFTLAANVENGGLLGSANLNMTGNSGNNIIWGNNGNNRLDGAGGADYLAGMYGSDTYVVDNITTSWVLDGVTHVGDFVEDGDDSETGIIDIDTVEASVTYTLGAFLENLTLTGVGAINGTGNELDNVLRGNSAKNALKGKAGNDIYYVSTGDTVTENAGEGTDKVISDVSFTLGANIEQLTLTGSLAINATGNTLANVIIGNDGNNILDGGTGADVLKGGLGNDTYLVDNAGDTVTENADEGVDVVQSSVSFVLGNNIENLTLTATSVINGTGNALDNIITGNSAANVLTGGAGNDTYIVGAGDTVTENANEGVDVVQSAIAWILGNNIENLTLTGSGNIAGTGNALDNILTGNSGKNVLKGGAGNDTYIVGTGDTVTENSNEGTDTVQSSVAFTLGNNIENLTLIGTGNVAGTGNALDNILTGNSGTNALSGGAGNDTYIVGAGDTVTEGTNAGVDTVQSSVAFTLGANVENLTLTGSTAINGTGNTLANVLRGNSAANTLSGGAGNDTYLFGRGGAADIIVDTDSTVGNADRLLLDSGIAYDQLWFKHVGTSLEVSVIGTSDKVTISNWYNGTGNHVEKVQVADGHYLVDTKVEALVQAMAGMTAPPAGQLTLTTAQHQQLDTVLAASWAA